MADLPYHVHYKDCILVPGKTPRGLYEWTVVDEDVIVAICTTLERAKAVVDARPMRMEAPTPPAKPEDVVAEEGDYLIVDTPCRPNRYKVTPKGQPPFNTDNSPCNFFPYLGDAKLEARRRTERKTKSPEAPTGLDLPPGYSAMFSVADGAWKVKFPDGSIRHIIQLRFKPGEHATALAFIYKGFQITPGLDEDGRWFFNCPMLPAWTGAPSHSDLKKVLLRAEQVVLSRKYHRWIIYPKLDEANKWCLTRESGRGAWTCDSPDKAYVKADRLDLEEFRKDTP
jgi:hypothetical protein